MKRMRIGNDFVFNWAIERGGLPEDLSSVLEAKLTASVFDKKQEVPFTVSGNIITIEFTPEICNVIGLYNLLFTYILPDTSLSDEERKCAVDVDAFQIVAKTAQADDSTEFAMTSDMAIAFKGDKGDSAYQVWLEEGNTGTEDDYFAYLRQPATDAAASVSELEQTVSDNEALRVTAEQGRRDAELLRNDAEGIRDSNEIDRIEAEGIRDANETARINAESNRVDAEDLRDQAEIAREEAEGLRQTNTSTAIQNAVEATTAANTAAGLANNAATAANTAAGDANDAATAANTAAGLADKARTELTTAVNTKLDEADGKIEEMNETLSTYDGRVTQVESDISQLAGDVNELGIKDAVQGAKIKDIENVLSTANIGQSAKISVTGTSPLSLPKNAANSGMSVKLEGLTEDVGGVITHFEPTGRVRSVDKDGLNHTALYLTAPELRSIGLVKDEIRKGSNGYELVKRVADVVPTVTKIDTSSSEFVDIVLLNIANKVWSKGENVIIILPDRVIDTYSSYTEGIDWTYYFGGTTLTLRINVPKGHFANLAEANTYFSSGYVTHAVNIPEIIPISYGGILNSAENGTVYHEPIIADAGVYETKMDIMLTDYPIASIVEIIKHENGVDTYLNVASAVVASDGLSFTHPDLASGDLVLFTYAFDKESTNGNITATFYDSNVVKIDTVTGKAYKIEDVITNGVLTRTLTEV